MENEEVCKKPEKAAQPRIMSLLEIYDRNIKMLSESVDELKRKVDGLAGETTSYGDMGTMIVGNNSLDKMDSYNKRLNALNDRIIGLLDRLGAVI